MSPTLSERFWAKVDKAGVCWNWIGGGKRGGYGVININNKTVGAHRASYELNIGEIKDGLHVLHHCDNKRCVRPDHLHLGTQKENNLEAIARGLKKPKFKKYCIHGHEFTAENCYRRASGGRKCRACALVSRKAYKARKRASIHVANGVLQ